MTKRGFEFPVLTTERLRLRLVGPQDIDALHDCFSDPEAMRYWNMAASKTLKETERWTAWLAKTTSPYEHLAWGIADKKTDRCLGMVNYHNREARHRRLEIGYIVAPASQRKGIATEAVGAMLAHCSKSLGVHRFDALINPDNAASIKLAERLGFACEGGPLKDYWCVDGVYQSVMVYGRVAIDS